MADECTDQITIKINNWKKYQGRKDIKNPWWFKLNNSILEDHDIYALSHAEFRAWISIMCHASKKKSDLIVISYMIFDRQMNVPKNALISLIEKFQQKGILAVICTDPVHDPHAIRPESVLQKRREEKRREKYIDQTSAETASFDLESVYQSYPRKIGKKKGIQRLIREVKSQEDFAGLKKAVEHYSHFVRGKDLEYIKHFSSFVSEWRDWVNPDPDVFPSGAGRKKINAEDLGFGGST